MLDQEMPVQMAPDFRLGFDFQLDFLQFHSPVEPNMMDLTPVKVHRNLVQMTYIAVYKQHLPTQEDNLCAALNLFRN
jgi:hypothetical protein